MSRPRRREREIEQARSHILDAAARVFATKGYSEATIQEIAAAAEYSPPTLYTYFKNKQAIFDGIVDVLLRELPGLFDVDFPEGLTLRQRIELLLRHWHGWIERRRDVFLFLLQQGPSNVQERGEHPLSIRAAHLARLADWFEEHAAEAELGGRSPESAALALDGLTQSWFMHWVRQGGQGSPADELSEVLDFFFYGLSGPRDGERRS